MVHPTTYQGKYIDPTCDTFHGNYINFYNDFVGEHHLPPCETPFIAMEMWEH